MSTRLRNGWGGNREGGVFLANSPNIRFGDCFVDKEKITLPNGAELEGCRGVPVENFLGLGTLAVAVRHSGDHYNTYVPVSVQYYIAHGQTIMRPYIDLQFGAYDFGEKIGTLDYNSLCQIQAGGEAIFDSCENPLNHASLEAN